MRCFVLAAALAFFGQEAFSQTTVRAPGSLGYRIPTGPTILVPRYSSGGRRGRRPLPPPPALQEDYSKEWMGKENIDKYLGKISSYAPAGTLRFDRIIEGYRGLLPRGTVVAEIVDDHTAYVRVKPPTNPETPMASTLESSEKMIRVEEHDFSRAADGDSLASLPVVVTGMHMYDSVSGTRSPLACVKPISAGAVTEESRFVAPGMFGRSDGESSVGLPYKRRWTLASTNSHVDATYYGFDRDSGTVFLITPERELVKVGINVLDSDQRKHVQKLISDYVEVQRYRRQGSR